MGYAPALPAPAQPIPRPQPTPRPRPKNPRPPAFVKPGAPKPAQKPAPLPVIGPIPAGPVLFPPGIISPLSIKLASCHFSPALGAVSCVTRLSDNMSDRCSTVRTNTISARPCSERPAHSTFALAASRPGPLTARTCPVTSWHDSTPFFNQPEHLNYDTKSYRQSHNRYVRQSPDTWP